MSSITLKVIREEHGTLAAILRSLRMLAERGPGKEAGTFFDAMRAMLFYIDEFPERQHHPKETELLFPPIAQRAPEVAEAIAELRAAGRSRVLSFSEKRLLDTAKTLVRSVLDALPDTPARRRALEILDDRDRKSPACPR